MNYALIALLLASLPGNAYWNPHRPRPRPWTECHVSSAEKCTIFSCQAIRKDIAFQATCLGEVSQEETCTEHHPFGPGRTWNQRRAQNYSKSSRFWYTAEEAIGEAKQLAAMQGCSSQ